MLTNGPNIYQAARKESCLTQEQAAERLEVSETTVKAWEQGARVPDNETVARMAELYETPWLALEHLKQAGGVLGVLPEVNVQSLPTAAITLINRVLDFAERHRDRQLLRIAERAPGLRRHMPGPGRHRGCGAAGEIHVGRAAEGKKRTPRDWHLRAFGSGTCIQER